ncbi:MAG: ligase-associated DNA damage response DEXH box helicase [Gemmataceae bacterium]
MTPRQRVEAWFDAKGWTPFQFQREVWDAYAAGESGLIHSATGTGKSYAAWLGPVQEWLAEPAKSNGLRVLWITPLRALAADTAATLQAPLSALGVPWTVETRTGDTTAASRARQRKQLPDALVTTPESLTLFLTRPEAADLYAELRCVVVDEWHELMSSKRGVQTELALARLRHWRPNLRTWGLSATLGNLAEAMATLVGQGRPARLVRGHVPKSIVIDTLLPERIERFSWAGHRGLSMVPQVVEQLREVRTALLFTNTRLQAEAWYQSLLLACPEWTDQLAIHHGSLAHDTRTEVEDGLRAGRWRCVVCTSSLDLGVDFSPVDRVLQVGSPKGIARLLQRAGRSGHQPGAVSRVTCVPAHALELVEFAAARTAAEAGQIEGRAALSRPLDVLTQHMVTVALGGGFKSDELRDEVRTTYAYRDLTDIEWTWALDFVTRGGSSLAAYPDFRRVTLVDGEYRVTDRKIAHRHRLAIGTILGDSALEVRYLRGGRLGTVEESFAARLRPGDSFIFAGHQLQLAFVREGTVWVRKARKAGGPIARWMGSRMPLSTQLAAAVREQVDSARHGIFVGPEMSAVRPLLELQAQWSQLPARDQVLIERLQTRSGFHLFVYPFEGRLVHEGLAALITYRLTRVEPNSVTISCNDYGFELLAAKPLTLDNINELFSPSSLADDILASMNAGELARRHFREIARVAGLIFPGYPGSKTSARHLQASASLFYDVFTNYDPDNLLLQQAQGEVLQKQLEISCLGATLARLNSSRVVLVDVPRPTPLGFPLFVERWRSTISNESLADRVKRMQVTLDRAADRALHKRRSA